MSTQSAFFHALLRPSILQILRATGYHAARPSVVDALTDIAARYLTALCLSTASHAVHNHGDAGDYTVVDVRMALQDVGALLPERSAGERAWLGREKEDDDDDDDGGGGRRVDDGFIEWFAGQRMRELLEVGAGDGEAEGTDYLSALKKKHSKTAEESKYTGTVIGKPLDTITEIQVEGGPVPSISEWIAKQRKLLLQAGRAARQTNGSARKPDGVAAAAAAAALSSSSSSSPAASSGLSSVGSRLAKEDEDEMDLS
ncbi:hypothetical protein E4U41_006562 [Claviceps citrina]|nr:hypothetical protein E4U41_006562 [Claviceps citrina]